MRHVALLAASFLGSIAVVLLERGLYFFTENQFSFSRTANLWLGLTFGLSYVVGALASHTIAVRFGERRVLLVNTAGQVAIMLALTFAPQPATVWACFPPFGLLSGGMWPIIESYVTAGLAARRMLTVVGRFCIAWSAAVPVALMASGPLIASRWPPSVFVLGALCCVAIGGLFLLLPARPLHLAHDDPQRPDPARTQRYEHLLTASRWSMLGAYALLFLLAPLMPYILVGKLQLSTEVATTVASLIDWARFAAFALLGWMTAWYGRASPLVVAVLLMPASFLTILFGPSVTWVVIGEVVFGLISGLVYYGALYYALALKNAAVEAGGAHEALVGSGFVIGPLCGLVGLGLADAVGSYVPGMLIGVAPLVLVCAVAALRPLLGLRPAST